MSLSVGARVIAFLKLGRPQFLPGAVLLYGLGAALAAGKGVSIDWHRYAWGQAIVTATQWMTHYSNEFFDLDADRANFTPTRWSGGSRVLVSGAVAPRVAIATAILLAACAFAASIGLATRRGTPVLALPLALVMIGLSWFYSAPPLRLLSRGLGELTTALVVTLLVPLLGFYVQSGSLEPVLFLACIPLCCLQFAMLLTIEFPDAAGDAAQGKRTLIVRRGAEWGGRCCALAVLASFAVLPLLWSCGLPAQVAMLALLPAPLAAWHALRLWRGAFREPSQWEGLALSSVALLGATSLAELVGATWLLLEPAWR